MELDTFWNYLLPLMKITNKTKQNYNGAYKRNISKTVGKQDINLINKQSLLAILDPLAPQNAYQTLMVMRAIFREANDREITEKNTAKSIKCPKVVVKLSKFLTFQLGAYLAQSIKKERFRALFFMTGYK